jgi:hypothetical protein
MRGAWREFAKSSQGSRLEFTQKSGKRILVRAGKGGGIETKMNATLHPFFTKMTSKATAKQTSKTYGRGKLRINLNSPNGNIYAIWGVARNLMIELGWDETKRNETLASLQVGNYEECLEAFGKHKVFGSLFKLYYSPSYMLDWDEGEWGNPNEEEDEDEDW